MTGKVVNKETETESGEKGKIPRTPLKEREGKGKEKENQGFHSISIPRARERAIGGVAPEPPAEGQLKLNDSFEESFFDPVEEAVRGAVEEFGGTMDNYRLWTWYAQRLGLNTFLNAWQAQTEYVEAAAKTRWPVRNLPAAFQSQLKRLFRARFPASAVPDPRPPAHMPLATGRRLGVY